MRRRTLLLGGGAAACTPGKPRLNVFNWSNYVAPGTIARFEREAGASLRYAVYESNEEMLAKVMTGNSGWDVAFPSNYLIAPMRDNGLLARTDHRRLPHAHHLERAFQSPAWDPGLDWSVPYMWGGSGIVYDSRSGPAPTRWADLWSGRYRGRETMLDDPAEVLGACLKKLGYPLNSTHPSQLAAARAEAIALKPMLRAYLNAEARDQLVSGDLLAAQLWATTSQQAMDAAPHLRFLYPAEGFALYADNCVILRESRRPELAHAFIDYLLRPEVAAEIVEATRTATTNAGARRLLAKQEAENPTLYPPAEVLARAEWFEPLPAGAQRLRDRIWTEIKSA